MNAHSAKVNPVKRGKTKTRSLDFVFYVHQCNSLWSFFESNLIDLFTRHVQFLHFSPHYFHFSFQNSPIFITNCPQMAKNEMVSLKKKKHRLSFNSEQKSFFLHKLNFCEFFHVIAYAYIGEQTTINMPRKWLIRVYIDKIQQTQIL